MDDDYYKDGGSPLPSRIAPLESPRPFELRVVQRRSAWANAVTPSRVHAARIPRSRRCLCTRLDHSDGYRSTSTLRIGLGKTHVDIMLRVRARSEAWRCRHWRKAGQEAKLPHRSTVVSDRLLRVALHVCDCACETAAQATVDAEPDGPNQPGESASESENHQNLKPKSAFCCSIIHHD